MTVRMWSGIARTCETLSKPRGDEQIARSPGDVAPTEDETEGRRERDEGQEGAGGRRGGESEKVRDAAACVRVRIESAWMMSSMQRRHASFSKTTEWEHRRLEASLDSCICMAPSPAAPTGNSQKQTSNNYQLQHERLRDVAARE